MKHTAALNRNFQSQGQLRHAIRNGLIPNNRHDNYYCTIKHWLQFCEVPCDSNTEYHRMYIDQYCLLLEVICDECLPISYRQNCLDLINIPLFRLKECEEYEQKKGLSGKTNCQIKVINTSIFYEFQQTYKFFKHSLGIKS
ncbi:hypothetical protein TYM08_P1368 [Marinicellulosiphila megalodicopiae]